MKILLVSNYFPPLTLGGAEIVAYRQAIGFKAAGHSVTVFCGYTAEEPIGFLTNDLFDGISVFRCRLRSAETDADFYWETAAVRFRSVIKFVQPDVIHFHNVSGLGVYLVSLGRDLNIPCFVTLHDYWGFCLKNTLLKNDNSLCLDSEGCATCLPQIQVGNNTSIPIRLRRDFIALCLSCATKIISPSGFLAKKYNNQLQLGRSVEVVSNGIEINHRTDLGYFEYPRGQKNCVDFVFFAHLGPHKGIRCLLEALRILLLNEDLEGKWRIFIAGQGRQKSDVEELCSEPQAKGRVIFCGALKHSAALDLVKNTDVQILSSIWPENEPVSILESIECGKTQICSNVGGIPELVIHEETGLLFEAGNHHMLAQMMGKLINNPELIRRYSAKNASRRMMFDEKITINRLLRFYSDSLNGREPDVAERKRRFVISCAGTTNAIEVDLILANLHKFEDRECPLTFVWNGWVHNHMWNRVDALWIWGSEDDAKVDADWESIIRAWRSGLPVLAPKGSETEYMIRSVDPELIYETWQDAFEIIGSLPLLEVQATSRVELRKRLAHNVSQILPERYFEMHVEGVQ